jgi:hypothetical protein
MATLSYVERVNLEELKRSPTRLSELTYDKTYECLVGRNGNSHPRTFRNVPRRNERRTLVRNSVRQEARLVCRLIGQ